MKLPMQSQAQPSEWTEALCQRWWQRMSEIFGRAWVEQFGDKPTASWHEEMRTWSLTLAAAVLVYYRRAGLKFPPNLSETAKLARDLKPSLTPIPTARKYPPNEVAHAFAVQHRHDSEWIEKYRRDNPGTTVREAAVALLRKRGHISRLPEAIRAEAVQAEADALKREATVVTARAKAPDFDSALEAHDERAAIQADG